jgi:hypothetical protein
MIAATKDINWRRRALSALAAAFLGLAIFHGVSFALKALQTCEVSEQTLDTGLVSTISQCDIRLW